MPEPLGADLFGEPYFVDSQAVPEPDPLPEFTRETLPRHFRTWQQISDAGLEPVGPPVGLLVWTPRDAYSSKSTKVYDASRARVPAPREPDIFDLCEDSGGLDREVLALAPWSRWVPLAEAEVPRMPGVYLARWGPAGLLIYAGRAGERRGEGLRGRLRRYTSGKALASGLGEAVFDRALADPEWLRERLAEVESGRPRRATEWGKAALAWADVHVC